MMISTPTVHIEAPDANAIAKTVLMPGDPLRAKLMAETYLEDMVQFNTVRNMLGYTGTYKGKRISIMGSGMGIPSMGIYSYELFAGYDVDHIIRLGSCGSYHEDYNLYDIVLARDVWTESTYAKALDGHDTNIATPSLALNQKLKDTAKAHNTPLKEARIHCTDVFYSHINDQFKIIRDTHNCAVVEMESFALLTNAKLLNKQASCIMTVSDSFVSGEVSSSAERQNSFTQMILLSLETAISI